MQIEICQPHLISLRQKKDALVHSTSSIVAKQTSVNIFPLKLGRTTIGSLPNNDIVLCGFGIQPEHCFIENNSINLNNKKKYGLNSKSSDLENNIDEQNKTRSKTKKASISISSIFKTNNKCKEVYESVNLVTLYPIDRLCAIDGVLIDNPYHLNSGSILFFFVFIFKQNDEL